MISSNVNSLQTNQTFMNNNAHNIANSNTKASDDSSEKSQTNLAKELTDQIVIENVNDANVASIKTQDQMFGSLLDITV